eukprot:746501-Hanusia_phi.AAC.4
MSRGPERRLEIIGSESSVQQQEDSEDLIRRLLQQHAITEPTDKLMLAIACDGEREERMQPDRAQGRLKHSPLGFHQFCRRLLRSLRLREDGGGAQSA